MEALRLDPCPPKTRSDLEWDRVLGAVASRCAGPLGRELALALPFAETREQARDSLAQSAEAVRVLEDGRTLPVGEVDDVREAIERARVGGVLSPVELRGIGRLLGAARALRRFLASRRVAAPALFQACSTDPTLDDLADEISGSFEPDGTLADRASPRLRELRSEWHAARQRMLSPHGGADGALRGACSRTASSPSARGAGSLPVRSDSHERFPGIVHATSASGATLFVEPRAVVAMGNRLKVLEAEVKREEEAVYARLSALVADALPSVEAAARAWRWPTCARRPRSLARDLSLVFPDVVDEPRIDLRARAPPAARARRAVRRAERPVARRRAGHRRQRPQRGRQDRRAQDDGARRADGARGAAGGVRRRERRSASSTSC